MKLKSLLKIVNVVFIIFLLVSCNGTNDTNNNNKIAKNTINIDEDREPLNIEIVDADISDIENDIKYQDIKYSSINCSDNLNNKLALALDTINRQNSGIAESFKVIHKDEARKDVLDNNINYLYNNKISLIYNNHNKISFLMFTETRTPSNGTNTAFVSYNFFVESGKDILFDDVVKDQKDFKDKIMNKLKVKYNKKLNNNYIPYINNLIENTNLFHFLVIDGGIRIMFAPGEVVMEDEGIITLDIEL